MTLPPTVKYESGIMWENEMGEGQEENYVQSFDDETCNEETFWNA